MNETARSGYLTMRELMVELRIGRTTAYDLVSRGIIPSVWVGGSIRIPRRELAEAVRAGRLDTREMIS